MTERLNNPTVAHCVDRTVDAEAQSCSEKVAVDAGSYDPVGDEITLRIPVPGVDGVSLTVEEVYGGTRCSAQVTVVDASALAVQCSAPENVSPRDAPLSVTASGFDAGSVAVISVGGLNCCAIDSKAKRIDLNDSCGPVAGAPAPATGPLSRRLIAPLRRLGTPRVDVKQVVWAGAIEYRLLL